MTTLPHLINICPSNTFKLTLVRFYTFSKTIVPNHPEERKKTSPQKRMPSQRRFQSLDLNLNVDGAASISDTSSNSNYWHNFSFMKQKASFLYGNSLAMSRRTSDASSFVSGAQEIEDLYCDDEINPNLEDDPNMMLTTYYRNAVSANNDFNFPERPCLTDRGMEMESLDVYLRCPI